MAFEEMLGAVMRWTAATEALAAFGAEIAVQQPDVTAPPEIVDALKVVSAAAGVGDTSELAPPQQAMLLGIIRMSLHQALDLVDDPARPPGWVHTDPAIVDGYGRGSAMLPGLIAASHPDLANVTSFLDVGTGVGLLAVAAATVWPSAKVVGIDPWEPSLERARENIAASGVGDRITLRATDLASIDDTDAFDCVWVPTFFLTEQMLEAGLASVRQALEPGGWVVLGRMRPKPDPLADATGSLIWIRSGGCNLDAKRAEELLTAAGFEDVHTAAAQGPAPVEFVLGRLP